MQTKRGQSQVDAMMPPVMALCLVHRPCGPVWKACPIPAAPTPPVHAHVPPGPDRRHRRCRQGGGNGLELPRLVRAVAAPATRLSLPRHLRADRGPPQACPAQGCTYADESQPVRALLDLAVATAIHDAIGRQKDLAQPIRSQQDDHTPVVKENRPTLRAARRPSRWTVPRAHRGLSGLAGHPGGSTLCGSAGTLVRPAQPLSGGSGTTSG